MIEPVERRRVARLFVPRHLGAVELKFREVQLLDLSLAGARIEHRVPLHEGSECVLDLPRALGRIRLAAKVVWTRLHKGEQTVEGDSRIYQSGVAFLGITPEQQTALAAALEIVRTGE